MNASSRPLWKSAALLLGTFLLGGLLGGLLVSTIVQHRADTVRSLRTADGFTQHVLRIVDPAPAQRDTLRPLLQNAGADIERITRQTRRQLRTRIGMLRQDLHPHLTPEQRQRLRRRGGRWFRSRRPATDLTFSKQNDEMYRRRASSNPCTYSQPVPELPCTPSAVFSMRP